MPSYPPQVVLSTLPSAALRSLALPLPRSFQDAAGNPILSIDATIPKIKCSGSNTSGLERKGDDDSMLKILTPGWFAVFSCDQFAPGTLPIGMPDLGIENPFGDLTSKAKAVAAEVKAKADEVTHTHPRKLFHRAFNPPPPLLASVLTSPPHLPGEAHH